MLKEWWESYNATASLNQVLTQKLEVKRISKWNKEEFGRLGRRKKEILAELETLNEEADY